MYSPDFKPLYDGSGRGFAAEQLACCDVPLGVRHYHAVPRNQIVLTKFDAAFDGEPVDRQNCGDLYSLGVQVASDVIDRLLRSNLLSA